MPLILACVAHPRSDSLMMRDGERDLRAKVEENIKTLNVVLFYTRFEQPTVFPFLMI